MDEREEFEELLEEGGAIEDTASEIQPTHATSPRMGGEEPMMTTGAVNDCSQSALMDTETSSTGMLSEEPVSTDINDAPSSGDVPVGKLGNRHNR